MMLGRDVRLLLGTSSAWEKRFLRAFSKIARSSPQMVCARLRDAGGDRAEWLTQEEFKDYPEAERPGNAVHPLEQVDLAADGIDVSAHDIDISPDDIDISAHHTEIMFDSIETAVIGSHGLGSLSRLVLRRA
jgi:hypothetical protein